MVKKHKFKLLAAGLTIVAIIALMAIYAAASTIEYESFSEDYASPNSVAVSGDSVFVADVTLGKLYKASMSGNITATWDAGAQVNRAIVNGSDVYALTGGLDGKISKLDNNLTAGSVVTKNAGHTPTAAVIVGDKIYVANRFSSTITVHNLTNLEITATIEAGREPFAMTVAGGNIYVARRFMDGDFKTTTTTNAADVLVINPANNTVTRTIKLINGTSIVSDICASPDGNFVYVSSTIGRYSYPFTQTDRAWMLSNAINIINTSNQTLLTAVALDEVELGSSNPWGLECTADGTLVATISGTNEVMTINLAQMHNEITRVQNNQNPRLVTAMKDIPNYLPFLDSSSRTRVRLDGIGPRDIEIVGNKAYICQYFSENIAVFDVSAKTQLTDQTISIGNSPVINLNDEPFNVNRVRYGEVLWNDATTSYQQWMSCASCHPEGGTDALSWAGASKPHTNTKSMIFSDRTPPVLVRGSRENAFSNVRRSMMFNNYNTYTDAQYNAALQYVKYMFPLQSPYLNRDGTKSASAQRGETLFEEQGCAECHPAPFFTDMKMHPPNKNSRADNWEKNSDIKYDTPTLVETWRYGPWMNEGSSGTLKQAIEKSLPDGHGLTGAQIDDLTNYVGSIGIEDEEFGVDTVTFKNTADKYSYFKPEPGYDLSEITVFNQSGSNKAAKVSFKLYDPAGIEIASYEATLKSNMKRKERAELTPENVNIPTNMERGSYYIISITDSASGGKLATDLKITY